jgi:pimeloyl-ACP methyl ester carboxylesterase
MDHDTLTREAEQMRLPDGRRLGYAWFGAPHGRVVLYCHGFPASRLEAALADAAARDLGVRILAPDRPGFGASDPQPGRVLSDWPADVEALCDRLGVASFVVLGVSGGAPYGCACAALLGDRVEALALVGGLAPLRSPVLLEGMRGPAGLFLAAAQRRPALVAALWQPLQRSVRLAPGLTLAGFTRFLPAPDREVLRPGPVRDAVLASFREALRSAPSGVVRDLLLYTRAWGFEPASIRVPCTVWHGEADATVPVAMGRLLAGEIPGSEARFLPAEGHFSLPVRHMCAILRGLGGGPT